jgi:hypothetical protein
VLTAVVMAGPASAKCTICNEPPPGVTTLDECKAFYAADGKAN